MELKCKSNESEPIDWDYRPVTSQNYIRIVIGGRMDNRLKRKFTAQKDGVNTLTIKNASLEDGGTYKCIDQQGHGETATAEIVVIGEKNFNYFSYRSKPILLT